MTFYIFSKCFEYKDEDGALYLLPEDENMCLKQTWDRDNWANKNLAKLKKHYGKKFTLIRERAGALPDRGEIIIDLDILAETPNKTK